MRSQIMRTRNEKLVFPFEFHKQESFRKGILTCVCSVQFQFCALWLFGCTCLVV